MQTQVKQAENQASKTTQTNGTFFGGSGGASFFQAKLTVNQPGDKYEQEADAVAEPVATGPAAVLFQSGQPSIGTPSGWGNAGSGVQRAEIVAPAAAPAEEEEIQRQCADCEQEEQVQRMEAPEEKPEMVQRAEMAAPAAAPAEEEEIQGKCADCEQEEVQRMEAPEEKPEMVQRAEMAAPAEEEEIQRKCADCEQEEQVQRMEDSEEESEMVQRTEAAQEAIPGPSVNTGPTVVGSLRNTSSEGTSDNQTATSTSVAPTAVNHPSGIQASLKVGAPDDRFEREADEMAEKVQRMPQKQWALPNNLGAGHTDAVQRQEEDEPDIQGKIVQRAPALQRAENGALTASSQFSSRLQTASGGTPLPDATRQHMEGAFNADFSTVRIHTDTEAAQLSSDIGARAFTHRNDIYFNSGEYNPGSSEGQFLLAHELTHTVQQGAAVQRSVISTDAGPAVQRIPFGDTLNEYAHYIPGFSLFTVIIGYNPLTERNVDRNAVNLVQGLLELIPVFGVLLFNELNSRGILQAAFQWVQTELSRLGLTQNTLERMLSEAVDHLLNPFNLPSAASYLYNLFIALKNRVEQFVRSLVDRLIQMVKDALVSVLKALAIERMPAYQLLTKILHHDPITGEEVNAPTAEILADFLRMIGKEEELRQMQERGTLQRTADWLDGQIGQFMSLLSQLQGIFQQVWAAFSLESLRDPLGVLEGIVTQFTSFVGRVFDFAVNVAVQVLQFIKDSLLNWLRTHANGIRGYRLLTVLIGKDPVTDEVVERNARNILSGFVELVAGQEKFEQIQQSGAIERMATWLEGVTERLGINFQLIRDLFVGIWDMLTINDLIDPLAAFGRVVDRFGAKIAIVLEFVLEVIKKIIEVVLDIMQVPIDVGRQIVQRVMAAYEIIKRDPVAFFLNLLRAVKQGFEQFFGKIGEYLLQGLTGWLFSELEAAGIRPPQDISLQSIIGFVFEVLGISMERIWQKLGEHPAIGPERVARIRGMISQLTGIWTIVQEVITEGPGALWRHLQEQLSNLWDMVLEQVKNWVMERIVTQMVTRLLSMLDPSGIMAVVRSIQAMYAAVQSFIQRIAEIMRIINSFVGGILEIAQGNVAPAADYLERTMASAMPTIIGFLANQVGLDGLGRRIGEMIERVRELVDQGLTWLVNKVVTMGQSLLESLRGSNAQQQSPERTQVLNAGLATLEQKENTYASNNTITRENAEKAANETQQAHPSVFSRITVIDGGEGWDYEYIQRAVANGQKGKALVSAVSSNLSSTKFFNRGSNNFSLVQGDQISGWTHIHQRHLDPIMFPDKTKFHPILTESDIIMLLDRTLKHGAESTYYQFSVFEYRQNIKNTGYKKYRATANPDNTIRTFHPLD